MSTAKTGASRSKGNTRSSTSKPTRLKNKKFWEENYKHHHFTDPSSFALYCLHHIQGPTVDLGCGDGRDLYLFKKNGIPAHGVDASYEAEFIIKQDVEKYMEENEAPDNVYARFFWHAVPRETQQKILEWTKNMLFIEARTTKDKPKNTHGAHKRWLVDTKKLARDLDDHGFEVIRFIERKGLSPYQGEDPHLVRVIAKKHVI